MESHLSLLLQSLSQYRDIGLSAKALLKDGDLDQVIVLLEKRAEIFAEFCRLSEAAESLGIDWVRYVPLSEVWAEIKVCDVTLKEHLETHRDDLGREVGKLSEARRTLRSYISGESSESCFSGMA